MSRESNLTTLTGLWKHDGKDGKPPYMTGKLGLATVFVFKNQNKRNEKDPDYTLCVAPPRNDRA